MACPCGFPGPREACPYHGLGASVFRDRAHAGYPEHIDLVQRIPEIGGADKVRIDLNGNVLGGATHIGKNKINWDLSS